MIPVTSSPTFVKQRIQYVTLRPIKEHKTPVSGLEARASVCDYLMTHLCLHCWDTLRRDNWACVYGICCTGMGMRGREQRLEPSVCVIQSMIGCMSFGVGCRRGSDPTLLWLWCRPVATAPIRPLAWEPPHAMGAALDKAKQNKTKTKKQTNKK